MTFYKFLGNFLLCGMLLTFAQCSSSQKSTKTDTAVQEEPVQEETQANVERQRGGRGVANLDELFAALEMNEEQKEKFQEIQSKYRGQMRTAREDAAGDFTIMREKMGKIRDAQNAEIKEILSEDQFEKYEKILAERRAQRGGRRSGN